MHNFQFADSQGKNSARDAEPLRNDGLEVCSALPCIDVAAMRLSLASHQSIFGSVYVRCHCSVCRNLRATLRLVDLHAKTQLEAAPRLF